MGLHTTLLKWRLYGGYTKSSLKGRLQGIIHKHCERDILWGVVYSPPEIEVVWSCDQPAVKGILHWVVHNLL